MKHFAVCLMMMFVGATLQTLWSQNNEQLETYKYRHREFEKNTRLLRSSQHASGSGQDIDVTYYGLKLTVQRENPSVAGSVRIEAKTTTDNVTSVSFDLRNPPTIDSVYVDGTKTSFSRLSGTFEIVTSIPAKGTKVDIDVYYQGTPVPGSFLNEIQDGTVYPWIFTFSQPYGAPDWWPCKDDPTDKADSMDVWITCNDQLKAGSQGKLISVTPAGTGTLTYHWSHHYPISTYLVSICLTNFAEFSDWYKYSPTDSMEILNYVIPSYLPVVRPQLAQTVHMLEVYSDLFGLYPFITEKYGHAQMSIWGGMEHQTMTSIGGGTSGFPEFLIAHELAHQWFGDMITMGTWSDIWLNEGFATYAEALYYEQVYGFDRYTSEMNIQMANAKNAAGSIFVTDTSDYGAMFIQDLVYMKGSAVLHMLRHVLGDSLFLGALKEYATNPQFMFKNASTQDLQNVFEEYSGTSLDYFFNEWIHGENYPKYTYSHSVSSGDNGFTSKVRITQNTGTLNPAFFTMPIDLKFSSEGWDTTVTVFNNAPDQTFTIAISHNASSVELDPDNWILREADFSPIQAHWEQTMGVSGMVNTLVSSGTNLFAGTDNGVFLSTNNGTSWSAVNSGLTNTSVRALAASGTSLFVGTWGGLFLSTNNGSSWTAANTGSTSNPVTAFAVVPNGTGGTNLFVGGYTGVLLSTNNGTSWTAASNGLTNPYVSAFAVTPAPGATGDTGLIAGTGGGFYRSTDNGTSWVETYAWRSGTSYILFSMAVSPNGTGGTNLFAAIAQPGFSGVLLSTDKGATWPLILWQKGMVQSLLVVPNGTGAWSLFVGSAYDPFAGGGGGVWLLINSGTSWSAAAQGLNADVTSLAISSVAGDKPYLFAGTQSSGVWRRPLSEMILTAVEQITSQFPERLSLSQNYPNPFNPETVIRYRVAGNSGWVKLAVHDLLGREVAVLVDEEKPAGVFTATWNAATVPSGVYFCRITAGSFVQTKKMVLLR